MSIGIGGAIFLCVLILWPILVVISYYMLLRQQVFNIAALGLISIVIGYIAMIGSMALIESYVRPTKGIALLCYLLYLIVPVIITLALASEVSQKTENIINGNQLTSNALPRGFPTISRSLGLHFQLHCSSKKALLLFLWREITTLFLPACSLIALPLLRLYQLA